MLFNERAAPSEVFIVGRDREIAQLDAIVDDVSAGAKRAVVITGPPGIGKTTLLRCVLKRVAQEGYAWSFVRAPASAGLPPRFPLGDVFAGLVHSLEQQQIEVPRPLRKVLETLRGVETDEPYPAQLPQIAEALEQTAMRARLAIFIDDFHWAPQEPTQELIAAIRLIEGGALLAFTARAEDQVEPRAGMDGLGEGEVRLQGLSRGAIFQVVASSLGRPALGSLVTQLWEASVGNPLYVLESLRTLSANDHLTEIGGFIGVNPDVRIPPPRSLAQEIKARLSRLDRHCQSLIGMLALAARPLTLVALAKALRSSRTITDAHLRHLWASGFIASRSQLTVAVEIVHPMYSSVISEYLSPFDRAAINEALFRVLTSEPTASAAELAHHATASHLPPGQVRALLRQAASEALRAGGYREAATWFQSLSMEAMEDEETVEALRGEALAAINFDPERAVMALTKALHIHSDPTVRAPLLLLRAQAYRFAGQFHEAAVDLNVASEGCSSTLADEISHARAVLLGITGDVEEANRVLNQLSRRSISPTLSAQVHAHLGHVAFVREQHDEARDRWERALRFHQTVENQSYIQANLTWQLILSGEWPRAKVLLQNTLTDVRTRGDAWTANALLCSAARLAAWEGAFGQALDHGQLALATSARLQNPACRLTALDSVLVALVESRRTQTSQQLSHEALYLLATKIEPRDWVVAATNLVESFIQIGDFTSADAALSVARARADAGDPPREEFRDLAEARLLAAQQRPREALEAIERWLHVETPIPFVQARLYEEAGRQLFVLGSSEASRWSLSALHLYESLGAEACAAGVRDEVELRSRVSGRRVVSHVTPREHEVLKLIAEGLSDREVSEALFVSWRTARKHVENLMRKLEVNKRTQLLNKAVELGLLSPPSRPSEEIRQMPVSRFSAPKQE